MSFNDRFMIVLLCHNTIEFDRGFEACAISILLTLLVSAIFAYIWHRWIGS